MKIRNTIKEFAIITAGTAIVAAAVFFFMLPSHVSVGSGAALAMVSLYAGILSESTVPYLSFPAYRSASMHVLWIQKNNLPEK